MDNKLVLRREIQEYVLMHSNNPEGYYSTDITQALLDNSPDAVREYINRHIFRLLDQEVNGALKQSAGVDYASEAGQMNFGFSLPVLTTFRTDAKSKAKYIPTGKAKNGHLMLATEERIRQAHYNTKTAGEYQKAVDLTSPYPDMTLDEVVRLIGDAGKITGGE
jgi:hypothetical protein